MATLVSWNMVYHVSIWFSSFVWNSWDSIWFVIAISILLIECFHSLSKSWHWHLQKRYSKFYAEKAKTITDPNVEKVSAMVRNYVHCLFGMQRRIELEEHLGQTRTKTFWQCTKNEKTQLVRPFGKIFGRKCHGWWICVFQDDPEAK